MHFLASRIKLVRPRRAASVLSTFLLICWVFSSIWTFGLGTWSIWFSSGIGRWTLAFRPIYFVQNPPGFSVWCYPIDPKVDWMTRIGLGLPAADGKAVETPILFPFLLSLLWVWKTRDRRPIEGHCRRCEYNLTGNVSGRCPECGLFTRADVDHSHRDDYADAPEAAASLEQPLDFVHLGAGTCIGPRCSFR